MSVTIEENLGMLDQGFFNYSYLTLLLNNGLTDWAKKHILNTGKQYLMFVIQVESTSLSNIYLSLVYFDGVEEHVIPAGYVGQRLTPKEVKFSTILPLYSVRDLEQKPPFEVMKLSRLKDIKDKTGIVNEVAMAYHNFMMETCKLGKGLRAQLANGDGNALLFFKDSSDETTKIEFYLKDISDFVTRFEKMRIANKRQSIKTLININKEKTCPQL